jgi:hypothetical protein
MQCVHRDVRRGRLTRVVLPSVPKLHLCVSEAGAMLRSGHQRRQPHGGSSRSGLTLWHRPRMHELEPRVPL